MGLTDYSQTFLLTLPQPNCSMNSRPSRDPRLADAAAYEGRPATPMVEADGMARRSTAGQFLGDLPLQIQGPRRQLIVFGLYQKRIKAPAMVNRTQCVGANAQANRAAKRVGNQCHVA